MTELSDEERARLADVVRLQPTTNADLGERWGLESGSEVHGYLEEHLADYYYRDEDSYIRATPEATDLVDVEPRVVESDDPDVVRVSALGGRILEVVAGPDDRSESVVRVLGKLRERFDVDPTAETVRRELQSLRRTGLVEVERRTVPTFRRTPAEGVTVEVQDGETPADDSGEDGEDGDDLIERIEPTFERP